MIGLGSSSAKLLSIFPILTLEIILLNIAVGRSYSGARTSSQILKESNTLVTSFRTIVSSNNKYYTASTTTQTQAPNDGILFGNSLHSHTVKAKSIRVSLGIITRILAFAAIIVLLLRRYRRR